jgi:hypothetical protein
VKKLTDRQRVLTDFSGVASLREDFLGKLTQASNLFAMGYGQNVVNARLGLGMPDLRGGDVGRLSAMLIPDESLTPVKTAGKSAAKTAATLKRSAAPEYGSAEHEAVMKQKQAQITPYVRVMQAKLRKYFQAQQRRLTEALKESKSFGKGKFKGDSDSIPPLSQLFNLQLETEQFKEDFDSTLEDAVQEVGNAELEALKLRLLFNVRNPEVQAAIAHILQTVADKTNSTTWEDLIELFQAAELEGESIPAIMERLSAYYGDRKSDWQTERIARTTMTGATNMASEQAWKESKIVKAKTWLSALQPDRSREEHMAAHGQTVGIDELFTVGGEHLEYPGDPAGSPGNIINCLCTIKPQLTDELED